MLSTPYFTVMFFMLLPFSAGLGGWRLVALKVSSVCA
jgi:hypothetical protein